MIMTDEKVNEKRRHPRHEVDFIANLKVGVTISGRGRSVNISRAGICIETRSLFDTIKPQKAKELNGSIITIIFPFEALTIEGQIAWIDRDKGEIGLSILKTSDPKQWENLCKHG